MIEYQIDKREAKRVIWKQLLEKTTKHIDELLASADNGQDREAIRMAGSVLKDRLDVSICDSMPDYPCE